MSVLAAGHVANSVSALFEKSLLFFPISSFQRDKRLLGVKRLDLDAHKNKAKRSQGDALQVVSEWMLAAAEHLLRMCRYSIFCKNYNLPNYYQLVSVSVVKQCKAAT